MSRISFALLLAVALVSRADAQAYCALRDPSSSIFELFPEADSYRSHVGTVTEDARQAVGDALPFTLHFNELGRHTLYVPLKDGVPLGFVHVRSAKGRWGLVEIAWALGLDLGVRDFRFQRCRSRERATVEQESFLDRLRAADPAALLAMLRPGGAGFPAGVDAELATTVVTCALKTIFVTREVWPDEVALARAHARAHVEFASCRGIVAVESARVVAPDLGDSGSGIRRAGVRAFRVLGEREHVIGTLLCTPWTIGEESALLWWTFHDGRLTTVDAQGGWSGQELREAFEASLGSAPDTNCQSPVDLARLEVLALQQHMAGDG